MMEKCRWESNVLSVGKCGCLEKTVDMQRINDRELQVMPHSGELNQQVLGVVCCVVCFMTRFSILLFTRTPGWNEIS